MMQQLRYLVFHNENTPIKLSLPWQSSSIQSLSVSHHWNLHLELYTETLSIFYIFGLYIRLVVTL